MLAGSSHDLASEQVLGEQQAGAISTFQGFCYANVRQNLPFIPDLEVASILLKKGKSSPKEAELGN
jgi:hypothetical protein